MSWLKNQAIFNILLSAGCGLSLLMTPAKAISQEYIHDDIQAAHCCEMPSDHCCEEESSCAMLGSKSTAVILAGALLAGGVAIATSQSNRDGSTGPRGPKGDANIVVDTGQSLTFNFNSITLEDVAPLDAQDNLIFVILIPYVSLPNNVVVEGIHVQTFLTSGVPEQNLSPITIQDPPFGTYEVGVQVTFTEEALNDTIVSADFQASVASSRTSSLTKIVESYDTLTPITTGDQLQIAAPFTYDQVDLP